jgi:hypothetical protein
MDRKLDTAEATLEGLAVLVDEEVVADVAPAVGLHEGETTFTCNGPWGDYPRDLGIRPI